MLRIKLARFGKRNQPHYRIVVIEAKTKRDGRYTANLGFYAPTQTPKVLQVDVPAYETWLKKGAQPTDTVNSLVTRFQSGNPFPEKAKTLSKKAKAKQKAEKDAAAVAEATPAPEAAPAETPAVEAAPETTETPSEEATKAAPEAAAEEVATESK